MENLGNLTLVFFRCLSKHKKSLIFIIVTKNVFNTRFSFKSGFILLAYRLADHDAVRVTAERLTLGPEVPGSNLARTNGFFVKR